MHKSLSKAPPSVLRQYRGTTVHENRFLFIDGLRAIAAVAVVLYHLYGAVSETSDAWAWQWVEQLLSFGYLGVDVFFVLSGFVITYSIRDGDFSLRYLGAFGLRRSARLDPAYFATILLEIALIHAGLYFFSELNTSVPNLATIVSHFFYAQELLGYGNIVPIFWTLCFELQFYIVLVSMLVVARSAQRFIKDPQITNRTLAVIGLIAYLWSLAIFFGPLQTPLPGLFISRWWQFFIGSLLALQIINKSYDWCFLLATLVLALAILLDFNSGTDNGLATLISICAIYVATRTNGMSNWLSSTVPQFLGKLSYSIYLVHAVIGWRFIKLLHKLNGADFTPLQAWAALIAGLSISILSAWLMYKLIEKPSHRFSKSIALPTRNDPNKT